MGAIISCLGGKTMDEYNALESQKQGVEAAKRAIFSTFYRQSERSSPVELPLDAYACSKVEKSLQELEAAKAQVDMQKRALEGDKEGLEKDLLRRKVRAGRVHVLAV
eukprot:1195247-Prorocentrum_minimum.AAC.2